MQLSIPYAIDPLQNCFPAGGPDLQVGLLRDDQGMTISIADNEIFIWTSAEAREVPPGFPPTLFEDFPRQQLDMLSSCRLQIAKNVGAFACDADSFSVPVSEDPPRLPHLSNYHISPLPALEHFNLLGGKVELVIANAKGSFSAAGRAVAALSYVEGCEPHQSTDRDNCFIDYAVFERALNLAQADNFSVHTAGLALLGREWMVLCRRAPQDTACDPITLIDAGKQTSFPVKVTATFDPTQIDLQSIPESVNAYIIGGQHLSVKAKIGTADFSVHLKINNPHDIRHFSFKASLKRFLETVALFGECSIYPPRDLFSPVGIQKGTAWLWLMPAI